MSIRRLLNKEYILLFCIVLIGASFRFWNLSKVPPSLSHDEVAIGYNAYSILKTGKDEYGERFPILFRSFDDYKLSGMIYSTVPSIWIFGLNEWGVRFPSAFFGVITILAFYFLIRELVGNKNFFIALVAAFFFSISPWHINFSRQAFESNGSLFFLVIGTYFLLKSEKNIRYLIGASLIYAISLYFYYSVRVILPFILLAFLTICFIKIKKNLKISFFALFVGVIVFLPFLSVIFSSGGFLRISIVSIINDENYINRSVEFSQKIDQNDNIVTRVIYNRRVALGITVIENYVKNISLNHVFIKGTGSAGLLHLFEAPFFFVGLYFMLRLKAKFKWILMAWLLSAPLAGAFTIDQPNSLRTLANAPMFSFASALGFTSVFNSIKNKRFKKIFDSSFILILFISLSYLSYSYFFQFPKKNPLSFGDGYKQMVDFVSENEDKYKAVYISGYYWRPYIFTLFWKKYDPLLYQETGSIDHFGKYYFSAAEWDKEGMYWGNFDINFYELALPDKQQETLFILAKPEFDRNKEKFNKIAEIDGRYVKSVFVAGVLR